MQAYQKPFCGPVSTAGTTGMVGATSISSGNLCDGSARTRDTGPVILATLLLQFHRGAATTPRLSCRPRDALFKGGAGRRARRGTPAPLRSSFTGGLLPYHGCLAVHETRCLLVGLVVGRGAARRRRCSCCAIVRHARMAMR